MPSVRSVDGVRMGDRVRYRSSYRPGVQFVPESESAAAPEDG
jgi:hypothetical protein